ncbi:MAG: LacI family DNA-binding transcriptional regulator [Catenulispora sp.]|nr:LacI family DNA-binding transcriptional regulator [Catenulispora sp.]
MDEGAATVRTERPREGQPARAPGRPGLREVAEVAGVSHQTVSRVFKDHPRVSAQTRAKVLAAAAQLDFRPNAIARALATGSSRTIGVVSFDTTLFGPASMVSAIERSAREADYFVSMVGLASPSRHSVAEAADRLRGQGVDGIILIPGHVSADQVVRHLPDHLPVVSLSTAESVTSAAVDQYGGPLAAVRHLLDLGHTTVHHAAGPADWRDARERERGWRDALTGAGAPVTAPLPGDWSAASGYERGKQLAADPAVTAVFAANDHIALGVLLALHEAGRRVPEDVSVIGFDDIPEAAFFTPPLTTVRQDFAALGRRSLALLLEQIGAPMPATLPGVVIPTELVVRRSTARRL